MPAVSEAQRRYLYANFGAAWVKRHHFDNPGRLPQHVTPKKKHTTAFEGLARAIATERRR